MTRTCPLSYGINQSFMKVITHDLHILELQKQLITTAAKLEMFTAFVEELKQVT